ncbi:MAG: hypothetical protein ACOCX3_02975 [Chloroflexota bacterium]
MSIDFQQTDDTTSGSRPYVSTWRGPAPRFYPMPSRRKRGVLRWLLLGLHLLPFVLIVAFYPSISDSIADIRTANLVRLGLPVWALVLILHLLIVCVLDVREGILFGRRERQRRRMNIEQNRERMMHQLYARPFNDETTHPDSSDA